MHQPKICYCKCTYDATCSYCVHSHALASKGHYNKQGTHNSIVKNIATSRRKLSLIKEQLKMWNKGGHVGYTCRYISGYLILNSWFIYTEGGLKFFKCPLVHLQVQYRRPHLFHNFYCSLVYLLICSLIPGHHHFFLCFMSTPTSSCTKF